MKRIFSKILSLLGYKLSRVKHSDQISETVKKTLFNEMSVDEFLSSPENLNDYLINIYKSNVSYKFFTFPKYWKQAATCERYINNLRILDPSFSIEEGDVIIDAGAHHGIVSVHFASAGARVYAFEPNPLNFAVLSYNSKVNGLTNLSAHCSALDSKTKNNAPFNVGIRSTTGSLASSGREKLFSGQKINVKTVSLESVLVNEDLSTVRLLKVDTEGAEYRMLFELSERLLKKIQYICIEAHPTNSNSPVDMRNYLEQNNFVLNEFAALNGAVEYTCMNKSVAIYNL